jgi:hypothetical protein
LQRTNVRIFGGIATWPEAIQRSDFAGMHDGTRRNGPVIAAARWGGYCPEIKTLLTERN